MFHVFDFIIYCIICAYTPGANNILSMSNAARLGFKRSVRFNFGITAGFLIVMTVCTLFSAFLLSVLPQVKIVLQILGAAYMVYLAWKVYKSDADFESEGKDKDKVGFMAGMLLQFVNPKIYIYNISAMSLYILPNFSGAGWLIFFTLVLTLIGASGSYVWALCGAALSRFIKKHTKPVNIVMALLLVYCAVSLFL